MEEKTILGQLVETLRAFAIVLREAGPARSAAELDDVELLSRRLRDLSDQVAAFLPAGRDPDEAELGRRMLDEAYRDFGRGRFHGAVSRALVQTYVSIERAAVLNLPPRVKSELATTSESLLALHTSLLEESIHFYRDRQYYDAAPSEASPAASSEPPTSGSAASDDDEDDWPTSADDQDDPAAAEWDDEEEDYSPASDDYSSASAEPTRRPPQASASKRASPSASMGAPAPMALPGEPPPKPKVADKVYEVWYGTNRRPVDLGDASKGYSSQRDTKVHYGTCRVFIPASHKIGSIGSGWWKRLFSRKDDRLKLLDVTELGDGLFWTQLAQSLRRSGKRTGIVFIHGYNVSFEEAALRAAQIGTDLNFKGAMAFFSWPSKGNLAGYGRDGQTIEASKDAIATFLVDFAEKSGAESVHVIAHSMGNRGMLGAVNKIAAAAQGRTAVRFGQFILAAADVDADVFRNDCAPYRELGRRTTLYVSGKDMAVEAASWLYDYPRVGFLPPVVVLPGIDTVAVTNIDLTLLGHGYIAQARDVLKDMHALINDDKSPDGRFGLREARTPTGETYWEIGA